MADAGDDAERSAERSDEEERRRWLTPATMQSEAMRRSGAND
ncbi:uridylate kinase [Mycobacterium xenopi]|nr:uridylate kinase [Mycobacterium xenopi]